jgi:hypothetical protein
MKRLGLFALLITLLIGAAPAAADWRWAKPKLKQQTVTYKCNTMECIRKTYVKERKRYKKRIAAHDKRRLREWKRWTKMYIPQCTWYGESGTGPEYSPARYVMPNSGGSGAYGKFQFMPGTYHNRAKYHDWSALDQEIAARREFWGNGTAPWANC